MYELCVCMKVIVCQQHSALKCLWVPFLANPHVTSLVHEGVLGFKSLLAYAKCNRLSHKRGFMFHAFILFFVLFCFVKGLAKCKFEGI